MEFFLNAGLGIGILMLLLLFFKKSKKRSDYLFLSWIAVVLIQITFYLITIYHFELTSLWAILAFGLPLLGAPLLFLYIESLTDYTFSWKRMLFHLSIYPIYVLLFFAYQETNDIETKALNGFLNFSEEPNSWTQYYAIPLAISGLLYFFWGLALLRKHKRTIVNLFSFDEQINLRWLNYVVYSYLILFALASFVIFGSIHFQLFAMENAFALVGILLSLTLLAFGFYGSRQTAIFSNNQSQIFRSIAETPTASYSKSGLNQNKIEDLARRLSQHIEQQKPYLNEDLNLNILAEQCSMQPSQLSQVINQQYQKNFYDFVNQYRVEEAKKRLRSSDYDHLSVLGIAFDCGFKSKSSFNRYFKKYTGISPSAFKKKQAK